MDYHYEVLDEHRFQKLVQALVVAQNPSAQCMPIGQPDGGRDAFFFHPAFARRELVVVQVKFSRNPQSKTARDAIMQLVKSEKGKVAELIQRGVKRYVFATNVMGTGHPGAGSIDKVNKELTKAFEIPVSVWWRDDLDRRIDQHGEVKWSFPEILRATDLLPMLLERRSSKNTPDLRTVRAVRTYLATQYTKEKEIKFKQANLRHSLIPLFVDLPLGRKRPQAGDDQEQYLYVGDSADISGYVEQLDYYEDSDFYEDDGEPFDHAGLAAAFVLKMPLFNGASRFVIEGVPGQGKSTVTQFLCQVNRSRLLKKESELKGVDARTHGPVRVPFRVDLRDFAIWLTGQHPYNREGRSPVDTMRQSLESFLTMQVVWESGGLNVSQDELLQFFAESHTIIVLDGFDEVADVALRVRIVREIREASERLNAYARSMQLIVTSRPAAFASSPGFPEDEWYHLELRDMRRSHIDAYKTNWVKANRLNREDDTLISSTLRQKLDQPHLRDLARNPMQLAILLHLIYVRGAALPEQRTTLYDEYMKLFFNREAEKSAVVRDHRELLLSIHGVLAWYLHTQVEDGKGSGRIEKAALHDEIRGFLESREHDVGIADALFEGAVERVGALVSRVQGAFEFEVQPLREYFAARHLYKTAPYAPVGHARSGTRPERFVALARRFYWTNVARFFCGFYDEGELAGLVDGIIGLSDDERYGLINHPRRLAVMLLSDHVFSQVPKAMKRLIAFVADEPGFERLTSKSAPSSAGISLPDRAGRDVLRDSCLEKLQIETEQVRRRLLRTVIADNADREWRKATWVSRFGDTSMRRDLLREAIEFDIAPMFSPEEIRTLSDGDRRMELSWLMHAGHSDFIAVDPRAQELVVDAFFDDRLGFPRRWIHAVEGVGLVRVLADLLQPHMFAHFLSSARRKTGTEDGTRKHIKETWAMHAREIEEQCDDDANGQLTTFANAVSRVMKKDFGEWERNLELWETVVDRGFAEAPRSERMLRIAMVGAGIRARPGEGRWDSDGFTPTKGVVRRLFLARHKRKDTDWWRARMAEIKDDTVTPCLAILLCWGTTKVLEALESDVGEIVEKLPSDEWMRLWSCVELVSRVSAGSGTSIPEGWFRAPRRLTPRLALILVGRIDDDDASARVVRAKFSNYSGDDPEVFRHVGRAMMTDVDSMDWDWADGWSRKARKAGIRWLFPKAELLAEKVPAEVARRVLGECGRHCEQMVAVCEQSYSMKVAGSNLGIAKVASAEGWFVDSE